MTRTILHVDMDAFYASVEQRDHPEYRGKPVIVGSDPKQGRGRGIVSTCSYEARRFGIHSAQPISRAWKLCPHGIFVRPDMGKYARVSSAVMKILADFTDLLEPVSIDEAFLDVSGSRRLLGAGREIAEKIRSRIKRELGLTASVGVAANKFLAKIASDLRKPDGLVVVGTGREEEFLSPLPVGRLWGVGPKTEAYLRSLGLERIGQIAALPRDNCLARLGESGKHLLQLARGRDNRPVVPEEGFQSVGHEITFDRDTTDRDFIDRTLLDLSEQVARRLRRNRALACTVAVKFRESDFSTYSRRMTLGHPVNTTEEIFPIAQKLMHSLIREGVAVRLIGVHTGGLKMEDDAGQMFLFEQTQRKDRQLAEAMDSVIRKFGKTSITRAALVSPKKPSKV